MSEKSSDWCDQHDFIQRLQRGDPEARLILYDNYSETLNAGVLASLRKRKIPDDYRFDVIADTWKTVFTEIHAFENTDDPCMIEHWIRVISLNHVRSLQRRLQRTAQEISYDESEEYLCGSFLEDDFDRQDRQYWLEYLEVAMSILNPREQVVLRRWSNGTTPRQLASELGIEARSVSKLIDRSLKKMRQYLGLSGNGQQGNRLYER